MTCVDLIYGVLFRFKNIYVQLIYLLSAIGVMRISSCLNFSKELAIQHIRKSPDCDKNTICSQNVYFLCPRHKMARGYLVFALSVLPSFRHSVP